MASPGLEVKTLTPETKGHSESNVAPGRLTDPAKLPGDDM
jgi:hypothetical protein